MTAAVDILPHLIVASSRLDHALVDFTHHYNRHAAFWPFAYRINKHLSTNVMYRGLHPLPQLYLVTINAFTDTIKVHGIYNSS
jgi:hypothetical protein